MTECVPSCPPDFGACFLPVTLALHRQPGSTRAHRAAQAVADLAHACMGDRGATAFMHGLACNRLITTLSVKDNKLTHQGLVYILNAMLRRMDPMGTSAALRASTPPAAEVRNGARCAVATCYECQSSGTQWAVHNGTT